MNDARRITYYMTCVRHIIHIETTKCCPQEADKLKFYGDA